MKHLAALGLAALLMPSLTSAQDRLAPREIKVTGSGSVEMPPDIARLGYAVRGEGASPDAATSALANRHKAIASAIMGLLGSGTEMKTEKISVVEVRGRECDGNDEDYDVKPRLSQGACSIAGYLATMRVNFVTSAVSKSGTAIGLAARLGASDARLDGFDLARPADARMRAAAFAMADAKARAQQLATSAGVKLGEIVAVTDQSREGG